MGTVRIRIALLACLLTLIGASHALAQITAATVSGTVNDESAGVLPGVTIEVKNLDTGLTRSMTTDGNGFFTIPGLPPGRYEVKATLAGFASTVQSGIVLTVGQEASLTLVLKLGTTQETITVVGESALVDTRSSALSAVVAEKAIEQLPLNGRNYIDLALLQPGVSNFNEKDSSSSSNKGTKLNINGMGYRSNSYLLDGANVRGYAGTATVSAAETTLGVETIREFRVVTNAYSADYGRAMGGVISLVTKSGTNEFHGSAFEFARNSKFDARNFFDGEDPPPFKRNQFGGAGGGPIKHNKLFFFGGAERLQDDLGNTEITTVPNAAARAGAFGPINPAILPYLSMYPLPNGRDLGNGTAEYRYESQTPTRETFYQGRVDYNMSEKDSFFVRMTTDGADQSMVQGLPQFGTTSESQNNALTVEYKRIVTSALLNTARFSHSRLEFEQLPTGPLTPELAQLPGQDLIAVFSTSGLTSLGGAATNPSTNNAYYWTYSDDLSYSMGRHFLKVGTLIEHLRTNKLTATNIRGTYTFPNLTRFMAASPSRFVGVLPGAQLERIRPNTLFGFYAQDDFRMTDRITLNLGLRYEFYTVPKDANGFDSELRNIFTDTSFTVGGPFSKNPSLQNIAPRVGFAWDVHGNGSASVRGGAGMYYDTDGPFNSSFGISNFSPPFAPTTTINNPTFPQPSLSGGTITASARTLDYNIKQPYGVTYNVSLQQELRGGLVAMIGYAGSSGRNLITAIEGNPNVPTILADGTKFFPAVATRRNPAFANIDYRTNGGRSAYNSLQAVIQKRFSHSYQFQVSYTLGKAMDNTQAQLAADANNSSVYPQDPYDREGDWTRADFDVRHALTANYVWELPWKDGNWLLGGWQLNGIVTARSGVPFTPALGGTNWSRSGNTSGQDRPNLRPGTDPDSLILGDPNQYFDPTGFVLQPAGFLGNAGRNILTGPKYLMSNLSLVKNNRLGFLGSGGGLQLRLEVFNILNHANFATPSRTVFSAAAANEAPLPTAGQITRTGTTSRQLQLGVKLLF